MEARLVLIGECGVGKTAFSNKLVNGGYCEQHHTTIGVDYFSSVAVINESVSLKCKIWDTSGLKSFVPMTKSYYKDVAGAVLFYDVTRKETFDNLPFWINELNTRVPGFCSKLLIGNKIDGRRKVSHGEAKKFALDNGFMYVEMSVKNDVDVRDKLRIIAKDIYEENKGLVVEKKRGTKEREYCCCVC